MKWPASVPETLLGLIERYSPSGQEAVAVDWLTARMGALGYDQAFCDEAGNAVGVRGSGSRRALFLGHIDTVPGEIPVRVEGDILYGRGAVDAKGSLAAFVDAVAACPVQPGWRLEVIGAVGEEADSRGARHLMSQPAPELVVVGEPSGWDRITLGYKGSAWAEVTVRQAMAHSASNQESASELAVNLWGRIKAWESAYNLGRSRRFEQLTVSLQEMGSNRDGFEQTAYLRIATRLPEGVSPQDWYATLSELCSEGHLQPLGFPVPAYRAEKNTPLVRAFLRGIRAGGGNPGFLVKTGTADLNLVAPAWGCPALAYGPGDSSLDHTPEEHLMISEYRQSVAVLLRVLEELSHLG